MICKHCKAEIPPSYVHALKTNMCPGCGEPIMDEDTYSFLNELKETMLKMPNDPEGVAGWLISNYQMIKIGSGEPTEFYRKTTNTNKMKIKSETDDSIDPNSIALKNKYFKNAEINEDKINRAKKLLKQEIEDESDISVEDEDDEYSMIQNELANSSNQFAQSSVVAAAERLELERLKNMKKAENLGNQFGGGRGGFRRS